MARKIKSRIPATIKLVSPPSQGSRTVVDASVNSMGGTKIASVLTLTPKGEDPMEIWMEFADVCALRTLLEDLQAAHADAQAALDTARMED